MLYFCSNVFAFIITVGILVTIHELGHFIVARACGISVQRFSIGFGYVLWKYRDQQNTEYVISAIPLGGYVKMLSQKDILLSHHQTHKYKAFDSKSILQRACVIMAGPLFNLIFSFLIYILIFIIGTSNYRPIILQTIPNSIMSQNQIPSNVEIKFIDNIKTPDWETVQIALINKIGQKKIIIGISPINSSDITKYFINLENWSYESKTQNIITSLGIIPLTKKMVEPILSQVNINSLAMKSGLKIGDKILYINNTKIDSWETFIYTIKNNLNQTLRVSILREGKILVFNLKINKNDIKNSTLEEFIGASPIYSIPLENYIIIHKFNLLQAIQKSGEKIWQLMNLTLNMIAKLITGHIQLHNLGGPISIAQGANMAVKHGFIAYLTFLSLISINLSIINILPIPILDGGYLLLLIIEKFSNKNISRKIEQYTYYVGSILLILLICLAIFNDLSRL